MTVLSPFRKAVTEGEKEEKLDRPLGPNHRYIFCCPSSPSSAKLHLPRLACIRNQCKTAEIMRLITKLSLVLLT